MRRRILVIRLPLAALCLALCASDAGAQRAGTLRDIVVHGRALEGNTLGTSPDRAVSVYLPPSYARGRQRYPVLYLLHGIFDSNRTWTTRWSSTPAADAALATIPALMDRAIADGTLQEMIVVMPDADATCHYTDSPVKGGWSTFIARDLVAAIDSAFRTVPAPYARGLAGHSMGGHGALKIAMRHPGVFTAVYAMNPSLLGWGGDVSESNPAIAAVASIRSLADVESAGFYAAAVVGIGQCFAPDTGAPLRTRPLVDPSAGGAERSQRAREMWTQQMPIHMAPAHAEALRALSGLRFDSAFEDEFTHIPITVRKFTETLDSLQVPHRVEMYNGDHRNRLWGAEGRLFTEVLPFFHRHLYARAPARQAAAAAPRDAQEALYAAARDGNIRAAAAAMADGADARTLDTLGAESGGARSGRRALNYAALHNRAEMVRWLIARGADPNATNASGFTPLHHAAEKGSYHAAQALLELGADPNRRLRSGSTPLDVARQRGQAAVVRLLEPVTAPSARPDERLQ